MVGPFDSSPRRPLGFLLGMSTLILGANVVWVSYNNVVLPTLVERVAPDHRGLIAGLVGFFGIMVGITVSLLAGIASDHTSSRWGKRTPGILLGALLGLPAIALAAILPPSLPVIIGGFVGTQFFTNVANGAWWPLLVDTVPERQRGLAGGIQGLFTLLGAALGMALVTWLNENGHLNLALWGLGACFAASGVATCLTIRGHDRPAEKAAFNPLRMLRAMFHVRTPVAVFFWVVLSALLANMGLNSMQFFARFFFEVYFPWLNPDAGFRLLGLVSLLVTVLAAVFSGLLSDRLGRRRIILAGLYLSAAATLAMGLTDNLVLFLILAAFRAAATGPIVAVMPALAGGLAPRAEAGQYMAYNNLSTGLSGALAALLFGLVLTSPTKAGFVGLFVVSALLFLAGGLVFHFKVLRKELEQRIGRGG